MIETPTMLASACTSASYAGADIGQTIPGVIPPHMQAHRLGVPMAAPARRIVQVFIADSNENIPLDDCVLYKGEQKLTDATDQELFFELDIKSILEEHNKKRTKVIDKKVKDRTEYLEPAKVRDLKMVVVTVASL